MKKLITILLAFAAFSYTYAQVPQGISYQAIAFNSGGNPVVSSNVSVRISILDNSATGTLVYQETHTKTTNNKGLFNLNIGQGTPVSGTFAGINWSTNSKFLKVELDPAGGTNYTSVGTNQLMSVPFALVAGSANNIGGTNGTSINDQIVENKSSNIAFDDNTDNKVYVFNAKKGTWSSQAYNANTYPTIKNANGSFLFDDNTDNKIYICNSQTGVWSSQAYNANTYPTIILDTVLYNYAFDDNTDNKIYVYNVKSGTWVSQSYNANTYPTLKSSNGNFYFDDNTDNKIYVFSSKTGSWVSQSYNSNTYPTIHASNGNIYFDDNTDNKIYIFSSKTGAWSSQLYNTNTYPTIIVSPTN